MIDIEQRSMLTDALTPPPGYTFVSGIATTFSLDLVTLLTMPLHLAWLSSGEEDDQRVDPLRVIEALRRTADKLTVICQRGRMQIPRTASPLMTLLEGMVYEAAAPHGGAFHPKVWLLRFISGDSSENPRMRLIVLSRNITDDGSWDISLKMDGECRRGQIKENAHLRDFIIKSLNICRKLLSTERREDIEQTMSDVMKCQWELPPGFDEVKFHVLGLGKKPIGWLPDSKSGSWDELGVISPFVKGEALKKLANTSATPLFLVARSVELDQLEDPLPGNFKQVLVLDERVEISDEEDDLPNRERGLHAKVFVGRRGWNSHLFIGSANATNAALVDGINVEFMAELIGKYSKVGKPETWLGQDGMMDLLTPYQRGTSSKDVEKEKNKKALDDIRNVLANTDLKLDCMETQDGWTLHLLGLHEVDVGRIELAAWPLSVSSERAIVVTENSMGNMMLGVFAKQDVTSLTGFRLTIGQEQLQFGLNLPLQNPPKDRDIEILKAVLRNRDGFVRYLMLLLGDRESNPPGIGGDKTGSSSNWWCGASSDGIPLFEMLARAFVNDPERLRHISQVIKKLKMESESGAAEILPSEFMNVWASFEEALSKKAAR